MTFIVSECSARFGKKRGVKTVGLKNCVTAGRVLIIFSVFAKLWIFVEKKKTLCD
jgi:hypothetical protein